MKTHAFTNLFLVAFLSFMGANLFAQTTIGPFTYYPINKGGTILGQVQIDGVSAEEGDIIAAFDPDGDSPHP